MTLLVEIALVLAAAVAVVACIALLPESRAPRLRRARGAPAPAQPAQLVALERLVSSAGASAVQAHAHLRPVLVEIVVWRLAARGWALDRMTEATGTERLGAQLWEIVRPDRPFPEDRYGPGVSAAQLEAMLDLVERL